MYVIDKRSIEIKNKKTGGIQTVRIDDILNANIIDNLKNKIIEGKNTFTILEFEEIQKRLKIDNVKGGNSNQKADILLDIDNKNISKQNEGFSIKSYLGNKPTLLNASGNTNFIFEVQGVCYDQIDKINAIDSKTKIKDRLNAIENLKGKLIYKGAEKETMNYNLKLSDSLMPEIIGEILLIFYKKRISKLTKIVDEIEKTQNLNKKIKYGDRKSLEVKIKKILVDILLGFFAGTKWNGDYESNGAIVMKKDGELVGFHIIELKNLKNYLFENIRLDTPSSTRHRFGKIYKEKNKLYFKLNLQLRF